MSLFKPDIEKMTKKGSVEKLVKLLNSRKDTRIRKQAAEALGKIGDPQAVDSLIMTLDDSSISLGIRHSAIWSLGKIGDPRAVAPLLTALRGMDRDGRVFTYEALGKIGDARAVEPLITALRESDKLISTTAANVLERLGWRPGTDKIGAYYWCVKNEYARCIEIGTLAINPLIAALKDNDRENRKAAAEVLGKIGDARAVNPLINMLKSCDGSDWKIAAEALGEIGDASAVEPLIYSRIDNDNYFSRNVVVMALVKIGAPGVDSLIAFLVNGENVIIRSRAALALESLYYQKTLNDDIKQWILAFSPSIRSQKVHKDFGSSSCHEDSTSNVGFPL
jgi:HEAT repeat protein